jgi:hypothetical protein
LIGILGSMVVIWLLSHSTKVEVSALSGALAVSIAYFFVRRWYVNRRAITIG